MGTQEKQNCVLYGVGSLGLRNQFHLLPRDMCPGDMWHLWVLTHQNLPECGVEMGSGGIAEGLEAKNRVRDPGAMGGSSCRGL